jgi:hypothetical protein
MNADAVSGWLFQAPTSTSTRAFIDIDFMTMWVRNGPSPTLLTTAPNNGLNVNGLTGGDIGQPGTTQVFGSGNLNYGAIPAIRFGGGWNFGDDGFWGIEAWGFILPKMNLNYTASGNANGTPLLTIPFLDAATGIQSSLVVVGQDNAGNPYLTGSVTIHSDIEVWGYELNAVAHSIRSGNRSFDLLVGFRSMGLNENLSMNQNITSLQDGAITIQQPVANGNPSNYVNVPAGGTVQVLDSFSTTNRFYGGQIGGRFGWDLGRLNLELTGKLAVGATEETASIYGFSSATFGGRTITTPGGVFALTSNMGNYSQSQFSVVPEIGLKLSYALTSWAQVHVGYNALYWSNVARPGAQIDSVLNSKLIPTGASLTGVQFNTSTEQGRPIFSFQDTSFWAQGITVGLEFRY